MVALLVPAQAARAGPLDYFNQPPLREYRPWYGFFIPLSMNPVNDSFSDLQASANTGCVLKIKLKEAKNPIITAVERISEDDIILKPT